MSKIAVITDSNSGITQSQGKELGIFVIPMPFMINEESFFEDLDLTQDEFYDKLSSGADVVTSQPSPESVTDIWDEVLKEYDEIVHIPMSGGLSGTLERAMILAADYHGKVQVVDNLRISVVQRQSVHDALMLVKQGYKAAEIKTILEEDKYNCSIYIMLDTLSYLKKGGRITPAAAMLGTVLKIKPVLQIQGDKLDAFAKARTAGQGKTIMINAIRNDMQNRFGGEDKEHVKLHIAHAHNTEEAEILKGELTNMFPDIPIIIDALSLSVACHIGPGALAIACTKNLNITKGQ
ncbi:MAG: DegV family protein [Lachnospiraceae bacterium]|nr:DegV family protein [Lachnospiraceae bacterium]